MFVFKKKFVWIHMQIYNKKFYLGILYEIIRQLWAYLNKKQYFCSPKDKKCLLAYIKAFG